MKTEDIVKHIQLQDRNLEYYKRRVKQLEKHVEYIKREPIISNPINLGLDKESYSKKEIIEAYNKMLRYEGITEDRVGGLIIDTFVEFLNGTHHSE